MKNVTILHGYTTPYRVPFFRNLDSLLEAEGIRLNVVIGQPDQHEDFGAVDDLPCFIRVHNKYFNIGKRRLVWEPVFPYIRGRDLVIFRQAKKHLSNYPALLYAKARGIKTAFWGNMKPYIAHGRGTGLEALLLTRVDHWFAYNDLTKEIVTATGFPEERITSVQNAIDTQSERNIYESFNEEELEALRTQYGIESGAPVAIFCSRLYGDKRIPFLLKAARKVREHVPGFHCFVVGDGVESAPVQAFAEQHGDWFHWVGAQYGREKIKYFKLAQFQLIPGTVGLHIVDSFAFESPLITTQNKLHGVEISYLRNGENGLMTADDLDEYVEAIIRAATDRTLLERLQAGCREAAELYTIENMAGNFAQGVIQTLG